MDPKNLLMIPVYPDMVSDGIQVWKVPDMWNGQREDVQLKDGQLPYPWDTGEEAPLKKGVSDPFRHHQPRTHAKQATSPP